MEICPKCKGKKTVPRIDFMKAATVQDPCPDCHGKGFIQEKEQTDGLRAGHKKCEVYYWDWMIDSHVVSTLLTFICPIIDHNGEPQFKKVSAYSRPIPRIFVEIIQMNTKQIFRRKGIMTKLLNAALGDPKIEFAITSYIDSTQAGKAICEKFGFVRKGDNLIWTRPEPKNEQ